jgi:hypothetical protein
LKDSKLDHKVVLVNNLFELTGVMSSFFSNRFPSQYNYNYFYNLVLEQADVCLKKIKTVPSLLPTKSSKLGGIIGGIK